MNDHHDMRSPHRRPAAAVRPGRLALGLALALAATAAGAGDFSFGGMVFANVSHLEQNNRVAHSRTSDTEGDLKRMYLDFDYKFDEAWSVHLTTDVNWLRHDSVSDVWVRHFYAQRKFTNGGVLKLGVDDMPWMALNNQWYGFRYLGPVTATRSNLENVADWGAHLVTPIAPNVDVAVSVVTGSSFKRPTTGRRADVEAYVAWHPVKQAIIAVGGYDGQRAQDRTEFEPLNHTARRYDVMAAWAGADFRLGARYSVAENWANLHAPSSERATNLGAWTSYRFMPGWSVFAYADETSPTDRTNSSRKNRSYDGGVEWQPMKPLRLALAVKRTTARAGGATLATGNEYGIWGQWVF